MDIGTRYIIGGVYNDKTDTIDIGIDTIYYVTEGDYVLSLKSEASKNRHSGTKTDDFLDYLQAVKE